MYFIGGLYMIMELQTSISHLNGRINHFGSYIRNQETKLYQNPALVGKTIFLVDFGYHPTLTASRDFWLPRGIKIFLGSNSIPEKIAQKSKIGQKT